MQTPAKSSDATGAASKLWKLANYIRAQVAEAKAQNKLVKTSEVYVRAKITDFQYHDGGNITNGTSYDYLEKPEWHWKHQHEFIETTIENSEAFREASQSLSTIFGEKSGRKNHGLHEFAQRLTAVGAIDDLSDEQIVDFVSRFTGDLDNSPMRIQLSAQVDGLWLKQESLKAANFLLRRVTPKDLEEERPLSIAIHRQFDTGSFPFSPPTRLDFELRDASAVKAQEEIERLVSALRLFRLGSVRYAKYSVTTDSILRPGFSIGSNQRLPGAYKYSLSDIDTQLVETFVVRIKPTLQAGFGTEQTRQPADMAFMRYSDAVSGGNSIEARITSAITCLEALYLKGEERSELSHKLSLRIASLLRLLGLNPLEIQNQVHRAYDIRSTHIHGGQVDKERLKDGNDLCQKVLEYARLSVVVFLQLKEKVEKDEFINKLDRALLDTKSLERVEKQLGRR